MSGVVELFSAVEAALNDREIAAYEDFTEAVREVLALARQAEALKREIAELREALEKLLRTAEEELHDASHALGVYEARALLSKESADDRG